MVRLSPVFNPPILKGLKVHPNQPFKFDFLLDQGDQKVDSPIFLRQESAKLIKYFLASLTVPENELWVNLSPYEKDRIIPNSFGLTEMGRDLLAEDYMLKQVTASLMYPEDEVGKRFWKRIYAEAEKKFGTTKVPVNTFNKVWIVPDKAVVYENAKVGTAYVVESKLKVMLEQDYLSLEKHDDKKNDVNRLGSKILREIVIPELNKEVNEGQNFAQLRQVYNSLILATWYKKKIKDSIINAIYADKNKTSALNSRGSFSPDQIYQRYLTAFKKGVYNYIKEEQDLSTGEMLPRKYFSGGANLNLTSLKTRGVFRTTDDFAMVEKEADKSKKSWKRILAIYSVISTVLVTTAVTPFLAKEYFSDSKQQEKEIATLNEKGLEGGRGRLNDPRIIVKVKNNDSYIIDKLERSPFPAVRAAAWEALYESHHTLAAVIWHLHHKPNEHHPVHFLTPDIDKYFLETLGDRIVWPLAINSYQYNRDPKLEGDIINRAIKGYRDPKSGWDRFADAENLPEDVLKNNGRDSERTIKRNIYDQLPWADDLKPARVQEICLQALVDRYDLIQKREADQVASVRTIMMQALRSGNISLVRMVVQAASGIHDDQVQKDMTEWSKNYLGTFDAAKADADEEESKNNKVPNANGRDMQWNLWSDVQEYLASRNDPQIFELMYQHFIPTHYMTYPDFPKNHFQIYWLKKFLASPHQGHLDVQDKTLLFFLNRLENNIDIGWADPRTVDPTVLYAGMAFANPAIPQGREPKVFSRTYDAFLVSWKARGLKGEDIRHEFNGEGFPNFVGRAIAYGRMESLLSIFSGSERQGLLKLAEKNKNNDKQYFATLRPFFPFKPMVNKFRQFGKRIIISNPNRAMTSTGGIDLTRSQNVLQTENAGQGIDFQMDQAQLAQYVDCRGLRLENIVVSPLINLRSFLDPKGA